MRDSTSAIRRDRFQVSGATANPVATLVATRPPSIHGSERSHSRGSPVLILSMVASVSTSTLGSRLKWSRAASEPASAESISRLPTSARWGSRLRFERSHASCGQASAIASIHAQSGQPAWRSYSTTAAATPARPIPSTRNG